MAQPAPDDSLDPTLKRDLFFGDLALTRRQMAMHGVAVAVMMVFWTTSIWTGAVKAPFPMLTFLTTGLFAAPVLFRAVRHANEASAAIRPQVRRPGASGLKELEEMETQAASDPDLASDPRRAIEKAKSKHVRTYARGLLIAYLALVAVTFVVAARGSVADVEAFFRPAPPATVELVDVMLMPLSQDFRGAITVDVTGGRVSQIAPYDMQRGSRLPAFRSFEGMGKYLVASDAIDLSRPGWLDRFKQSQPRPIDVGTAGDFLVLDVDPRTHDVTLDHIAAAVIGGQYYSRQDMRTKAR